MRRRYILGAVMAGGALLAACGSTSTQSLKPLPTSTAKKSTTTSATTSEYLNIYQGIPNSPVSSNGYPFSVPDSMRILAPSLLKKEVLDTKLAKIGDTYVGTTWTPTQRMEIYTAKMYRLYQNAFGLPQYLSTTGTYSAINKEIKSDVQQMFVPFYDSLAAVEKQMVTTQSDGLAIFRNQTSGVTKLGINTLVPAYLNATAISVVTHQGSPGVVFTIPKGAYNVKSEKGSSIVTTRGTVKTIEEVGIQPEANEWSHVWPVLSSGFVYG